MNTQTHLLLAAALLCQSSGMQPTTPSLKLSQRFYTSAHSRLFNLAVLLGAIAPDVSLFIMFGLAKLQGVGDEIIWGEMYYSVFWQDMGAITNSIPAYAGFAVVGLLFGGRLLTELKCRYGLSVSGQSLLFFGLAALLHCLTDLPLHVDDGHAHFWPFSNWVFESPVSYWDVNHYALFWQPVELLIGLVCVLIIWRRFSSIWVRLAAFGGLLSYGFILLYWVVLS